MPVNIAARRGAKAQRRKLVVAQKRKAEMEASSTAGRVRLTQSDPVQHCLLSQELFESGMGMLMVTRGATPYHVTMATFLLDTFGLGVKDVFLRSVGGQEFVTYLDNMEIVSPMIPVEPAYARKLLHDLVAWARTQGAAPHRDYQKIEPIFGTTDGSACDAGFQFGYGGKPLLAGSAPETAWLLEASVSDSAD